MQYLEAIDCALNGDACLFLGAGFGCGAVNVQSETLPKAKELAHKLCDSVGLEAVDDLYMAAELFFESIPSPEDAIRLLQDIFTVVSVNASHKAVASVPWRRVFTTNYDNLFEQSALQNGVVYRTLTAFDKPSDVPPKIKTVFHINGTVLALNVENYKTQLKLSSASYLASEFLRSDWHERFVDALQSAKAVFFVGYSMYDMDVQRLLANSFVSREKCFFVLGESPDALTKRRVAHFGHDAERSLEQFARDIENRYQSFVPREKPKFFASLPSFSIGDVAASDVVEDAVFNCLFSGELCQPCVARSMRQSKTIGPYLFREEIAKAVHAIGKESCRNLLISSELGNGKTFLVAGLISWALSEGYLCYSFVGGRDDFDDALAYLENVQGKVVLVFENFDRHIDAIKKIDAVRPSSVCFVLTARHAYSSMYVTRLPVNIYESLVSLNVNKLDSHAVDDLCSLFEAHGLWGRYANWNLSRKKDLIERVNCGCISDVLLDVMKSPSISDRVRELFWGGELKPNVRAVVLAATVLGKLDHDLTLTQIIRAMQLQITNDIVVESNLGAKQFLDFTPRKVKVRSSTLASFALRHIVAPEDAVECLWKLYTFAVESCDDSLKNLKKDLGKFSVIQDILPDIRKLENCMRYFDGIKGLDGNARNFHYWLQYAILLTAHSRYDEAAIRFDTSYSLLKKRNLDSFQVDNYFARFLLKRAIEVPSFSGYSYFKEANTIIMRQIHMEKTSYFPYRPALFYRQYYSKYGSSLGEADRQHFISQCRLLYNGVQKRMRDVEVHTSIRICAADLMDILNGFERG